MQTERKAKDKAAAEEAAAKKMVRADGEWSGDDFGNNQTRWRG
jgi:hypothetical protein